MSKALQLEGANAVRFYAALTIILYHFVKLSGLQTPDELAFIGKFGGFGVPLFFVLSGFVLCVGYAGKLNGKDQISEFYMRRFFRIAPLFYCMMMVYVAYFWIVRGDFVPLSQLILSATFTFNLIPGYTEGESPRVF